MWHHHKYADQEDENDDDEGKSLMEVTADLTNREGDGADENDEKVLISRNMHQVSVESMLLGFFFFPPLASGSPRPHPLCHCAETGGAAEAAAAPAEEGAGGEHAGRAASERRGQPRVHQDLQPDAGGL